MTRSGLMAGAAALALVVAAPGAGFAQHVRAGAAPTAGAAHFSGGASMHAAPIGGATSAPIRGATNAPIAGANVATTSGIRSGGTWTGGNTAWNGGGRWHGGGGWHHGRHGGWIPGAVAGAVVGGAIANSYAYYGGPDYYDYGPDYYADNTYYDAGPEVAVVQGGGDASYCAQRYRSWDPATGTYLGYDGRRHPCP